MQRPGRVWREVKEILSKKLNRKNPRGKPTQRWLDTVFTNRR